MNKIKELLNTNNIIKYSLILTIVIVILLSSTLAYYSWGSTVNTTIAFDVIADVVKIYYDAGADITGANLYPTEDKEDGIKKEITVRVEEYFEAAKYNLYLDLKTLPNELKHESFRYALYEGNTVLKSGSILDTASTCTTNSTNHIVLLSNIKPTVAEVKYTLYIWIDGVNYNNPNTMMNKSFEFTLHADGVNLTDTNNDSGGGGSSGSNLDTSGANIPNIVDGMIPIYYDASDGNWKKADQANANASYKWYDYNAKQWANVVLLNSDTARTTYNAADLGTTINMDDISAFYVWIPRYKYRVWSINRQACGSEDTATCEAKYAYPAFSTGIEIEFETETENTGNVTCEYNVSNSSNPSTLSDKCFYNGTEEITTTTDNTQFKDSKEAWYTHPAFTFGEGNEITGFWIGKFETTGSDSAPEIKPNAKALVSQKVSAQFTTSQLFGTSETYGINNKGLDAHMLKNTEWGAVVYLSHSNYGLCNGSSCTGMYINNAYSSTSSIGITTGRSGGAIAGNTDTVQAHYPDSGTTSTNKYFDYGYYTYDGKIVNYDGTYPEYAKDRTLGTNASTTGNIYGVYDMNGGANEYVMANMHSIPTGTYVGPIGTSSSGFNGVKNSGTTLYSSGNSLLATVSSSSIALNTANLKYFDTYSYGTKGYDQTSWNRSRLGDATGEVVSGSSTTRAWKSGSGITGSNSYFVNSANAWVRRGGSYNNTNSGPFNFHGNDGDAYALNSFRSSLS